MLLTLRGITVLVFAQSVNGYMENFHFKVSDAPFHVLHFFAYSALGF